jgi:ATP-dependent helicase/nuclease subunit A
MRPPAFSFPSVIVLSASAGSGKTRALTHRYAGYLLGDTTPAIQPRNLLAITFTNNAAREMRQRVLTLLKEAALGTGSESADLAAELGVTRDVLARRAHLVVEDILAHYDDFQVRTIDSFMSTVFRTIGLENGFGPGFELLLDTRPLVEEGFARFMGGVKNDAGRRNLVEALVELAANTRGPDRTYQWDPYGAILRDVRILMNRLSALPGPIDTALLHEDFAGEVKRFAESARTLIGIMETSGAKVNKLFRNDVEAAASGEWDVLLSRTLKTQALVKSGTAAEKKAAALRGEELEERREEFNRGLARLALLHAATAFRAPLIVALELRQYLESVSREANSAGIADVNRALVALLNEERVPVVYERMGTRLRHFLLDEFQDTSPLQWSALTPLISDAVAGDGSLFVVGDMKQSIFGFRGADWTIMRGLKEKRIVFPTVTTDAHDLPMNWRSDEQIVTFVSRVFSETLPEPLAEAAQFSGLAGHTQEVPPGRKGKGRVEVLPLIPGEEGGQVVRLVRSAHDRGYQWSDIAVLTPGNNAVVDVSGWLNDAGIPFLSYSSMNIRTRKTIAELLALLQFLDAPVDNCAFATFVLGDLWGGLMRSRGVDAWREEALPLLMDSTRGEYPYKTFAARYPVIWEEHIAPLLAKAGYLPLYDLVCEMCKFLSVFTRAPEEGAALLKLLEVTRSFEGQGGIKEFLKFADEEEEHGWEFDPPQGTEAVPVMTVHKAKGLQFSVVIALLYDRAWSVQNPIVRFDEQKEAVEVLKVNKDLARFHPELARVFHEQQLRVNADELHRLYVVLTRAKHELYVLSVPSPRGGKLPSTLLPAVQNTTSPLPREEQEPAAARVFAEPQFHHVRHREEPVVAAGLPSAEAQRGDEIHALLQSLEYVDPDTPALLQTAAERSGSPAEILDSLRGFLAHPAALELFAKKPGRFIWREQELVSREGALFRVDRMVEDVDKLTIVDFKTGVTRSDVSYRAQVKGYMQLAAEVFAGKQVRGVIAYVDLREFLEVQ